MKVLMIEHFLPDSIYTLELGRELKNYCDLSIFCKKNVKVQESKIQWFPEFYPGGKNKASAMMDYGASLLHVAETIRKGTFDIVHVQTLKKAKFEMKLYYRLRKYFKKFVYTVHNVLPHETDPGDRELYHKFYEFCDELIVHNDSSKKCLVENFSVPEEKISVIAHGAYQTHTPIQKERDDSSVIRFLQFGYIRKYKGIDILLDAIALIPPEKRKNLHFTIAGKHYPKLDDTDYKGKIRDLGIEDRISFYTEHIPDDKLPELFCDADFVLFPYRNIYGSGALLMAYTYEKPVIASDIPTFCEETDHGGTGILFESENPRALADAILAAARCSPKQKEEYRSVIRALTSEKYNWKKSAAKLAEVYQTLLEGGERF